MNAKALLMVGLLSGALASCGGKMADPSPNDDSGRITLDLSAAPVDARCVVITVTPAMGAVVTRQFSVSPGQSTVFDLTGLPTGDVTMSEQAFTQACSAVTAMTAPTWIADPVMVTLQPGLPVNVTFNLHRVDAGGQATVDTNFPPADNQITEFATAGGNISITNGPDGALWFTDEQANNIGRISISGMVTEFPVPTVNAFVSDFTQGPDGNLWFTEFVGNKIGRITTSGVVTEFTIPTANSQPVGITTGRDGAVWFSEGNQGANKIGRITVGGTITEFAVPTAGAEPFRMATGADNNVWFTEPAAGQIGRITPAGVVTEFAIPTAAGQPDGICAGPEGNLWFAEVAGNRIGRFTTGGSVVEFTVPTANSFPQQIAAGPDGNLWFSEQLGGAIGRITPVGVIKEFGIPSSNPQPNGLAAGSDGAVWFAEGQPRIGRIHP